MGRKSRSEEEIFDLFENGEYGELVKYYKYRKETDMAESALIFKTERNGNSKDFFESINNFISENSDLYKKIKGLSNSECGRLVGLLQESAENELNF